MPKRHGRRRRRRQRERAKLEDLQAQINQSKGHKSTVDMAKSIVSMLRKVSPNHVAFKPAEVNSHTHCYPAVDINPYVRGFGREVSEEAIDIRRINLFTLETMIRESGFADATHFEARLSSPTEDSLTAAYKVSVEGLQYVDIDYLSKQIAIHFKNNKRGSYGI